MHVEKWGENVTTDLAKQAGTKFFAAANSLADVKNMILFAQLGTGSDAGKKQLLCYEVKSMGIIFRDVKVRSIYRWASYLYIIWHINANYIISPSLHFHLFLNKVCKSHCLCKIWRQSNIKLYMYLKQMKVMKKKLKKKKKKKIYKKFGESPQNQC